MSVSNTATDICCPEFNPDKWDRKSFKWEKKLFVKDKVFSFFYMPLDFGRTMKRVIGKMETANVDSPDWMCLSDHTSPWRMDVYIDVDKKVPTAENVVLNGSFYSRVYEGPYKNTKVWSKDFEKDVQDNGRQLKKMFLWYIYCPKCAKKYGKNYVGMIGELDNN